MTSINPLLLENSLNSGTIPAIFATRVANSDQAILKESFHDCPIYQRDLLLQGRSFDGLSIIEDAGVTTVVFPSWGASVDEWGNIIMEGT